MISVFFTMKVSSIDRQMGLAHPDGWILVNQAGMVS